MDSRGDFLILAVAVAGVSYLLARQIVSSPFGRVLRAIREDEAFVESLGKNPLRFKVVTFAVSASLASAAGCVYAHYLTYIDPTSFTVMDSILVMSMVIIGGAGSPSGPVVGAAVLVVVPEALRFLGLPSAATAHLRQMFYGAMLVAMMIIRPRGLIGRYGFGR